MLITKHILYASILNDMFSTLILYGCANYRKSAAVTLCFDNHNIMLRLYYTALFQPQPSSVYRP